MTPEILDAIEAVLRQAPAGMSADELAKAFEPPANRTDLDVWLGALGDQRRVMFFSDHGRIIARLPEFVLGSSSRRAADGTSGAAEGVGGSARESGEPDHSNGDSPDQTPPAAANAATQPPFAAVFEPCVFAIVGGLLPRTSVTAYLQAQARFSFATQEDRAGFLAFARAEIEALVPESAAQYGLTAEQVATWRRTYDADQAGGTAGANPAVVDDPSQGHAAEPTAVSPNPSPRRAPGNSDRSRQGRPASAGGNSARIGNAGGVYLPVREPDLRREVQAAVADVAQDMARGIATTWDLQAAIKRAGGAMKATLTPARGLFAVLWACAVFWAVQYYLKTAGMHATAASAQRLALVGQVIGLATVPLCGVPWLGFRWWDLRTRDGLTAVDVGITLCVGGVFGLMLANVVVSLGSCMSGLLPG